MRAVEVRSAMTGRAGERTISRTLIAVLLGASGVTPLTTPLVSRADATPAALSARAAANLPNIAFFDRANVPVDQLQAFDAVVIDPSTGFDPSAHPLAHTTWIARTTGIESIESLWMRGYRGFLLDTADTIAAAPRILAAHPDARLVAAGPDAIQYALPVAKSLYAVVGESLVRGLDSSGQLIDIADAARTQRIAQAREFTQQSGVPVVSIDYCGRTDRQCARDTAARVVAAGMLPYVTDKARDIVGIGKIEVLPRKVLVVQDRDMTQPLDMSPGVRDLATPLNYMGYDVEYADFSQALPDNITPDRYAGVVAWIQRGAVPDSQTWQRWITARMSDHVPVAFLGEFGFDAVGSAAALGLQAVEGTPSTPVNVVQRDPMIGFEINPKPEPRDLLGVRVGAGGQPLLRVSANGTLLDQVGLTAWGGYALSPYTVVSLDTIEQQRWAIQPMSFLKAALHLQDMPSPSVTTENGRRLFMSHVDGDGFASRAEFPGPDFSGEALYEQIFTRYQVPMTLSVIEGEVGAAGLHKDISPRLEAIARKMFALPHVEIGTHTYSHPFQWEQVDDKTGKMVDRGGGDAAFSLNIPGYKFNIDREITGSIDYINTRLAPPGKKVVLLQWSGDCQPPAFVIRKVYEAGVYNFNGGDTVITKADNSWTVIAPIGVDKGPGAYQVYAPNQDENVYTNDWQGPFYGFNRVLETFDMTERPLRFKPIDVYYHMYSGTKVASLRALDQIFSATLKQPVLPVYVSEYIRKVLDWRKFAVAKEVGPQARDWIVRGDGEVRELHWPKVAKPSLDGASGVTGFAGGPDGTYIHIDNGNARFSIGGGAGALPYIGEANGFVRNFKRMPQGMRFEFAGHYQPFVKLASAQQCRVSVNGQRVTTRRDGDFLRFDASADLGQTLNYKSVEVVCDR
ncbi:sugar ABC transporter [Caballeronia sp. BR00000012568055]|uniref:sugar ABC transporter n=1 Tax=Caballeronia sp. BR00000012568055 TaxID=2918761 RepID=UPI0023F88487|nr:sugar ABC transporter [Caballeronia sp. BR00000012568055]